MSHAKVIRAWKDEEYRLGLSDSERAKLPEHPSGLIELQDGDLEDAAGGWGKPTFVTICKTRCWCSWFGDCPSQGPCNPSVLDICQIGLG